MAMIQCETADYQPGTGTRYILIHGIVTDVDDAMRLSCSIGDMFLAYDGHGSYTFNENVVPEYVAEKFKIECFMLDAIALTQFIKTKLKKPMLVMWEGTEWTICHQCGLPFYKKNETSQCFCVRYPNMR
jgi:hypothetical protein